MNDIFYYCAYHNQSGSNDLVSSYGLRPERTTQGLAKQLAYCVTKDKDNALKKIASIHPDRDLFNHREADIRKEYESKLDEQKLAFSNMNGQSIKSEVSHFLSATGTEQMQTRKNHELLMIGGIIIISLAIIMKNN